MSLLIYVILGIIFGSIFSRRYIVKGGLYIYILTGIIGALLGELFASAFISVNIFLDILFSIIFSILLLYLFKIAINKTK